MTDIMAREAFRSAVADVFRTEFDRVYGDGRQMDPDAIAGALVDRFGDVHYEHRTNEYGVPVMRLVITGEEVVDLMPASDPPTPAAQVASSGTGQCRTCGGLALYAPVADGPWWTHDDKAVTDHRVVIDPETTSYGPRAVPASGS